MPAASPLRSAALALLVLGSAVFGLGIALALFMLMFSPMMFDAPGSSESVYPWLIIASLALYPPLTLAGLVTAWRAFAREAHAAALRRLLLPLLGVALVVAAFAALELVCDGNFSCR